MPIVDSNNYLFHQGTSTAVSTAFFYDESGNEVEYQVTGLNEDAPTVEPDVTSWTAQQPPEAPQDPIEENLVEIPATEPDAQLPEVPEISIAAETAVAVEPQPKGPETNPPTPEVASVPSPEKKSKAKSRKKKFKPTLVTRLKLDADGEMVLDYSAVEPEKLATEVPACEVVEPTLDTPMNAFLASSIEISVEENLNETKPEAEVTSAFIPELIEPSTSAAAVKAEEFDEEAFLNSLDLEKLVLVEAQRDGKDVYEIHEVDPVTQEICDKPLSLPSRYVDLIISIMTQQDGDE